MRCHKHFVIGGNVHTLDLAVIDRYDAQQFAVCFMPHVHNLTLRRDAEDQAAVLADIKGFTKFEAMDVSFLKL